MTDLRSGTPFTIGDVEFEPIERTIIQVDSVCGGIAGYALKEPVALVVRSPAGTWRVDLSPPDPGSRGARCGSRAMR